MSKKASTKVNIKSKIKTGVRKKTTTNKKKTLSGYQQGVRAVVYDVWIGGNKLDITRKQCINQISIKETVEGSDSATLTIADPNFLYINDSIYQENKKVKIKMGLVGYTYRCTFNGYISAIDINFGNDGLPVLSIVCMDNTYRMHRKKVNKTYKNKTSAQIVKSIAKKYGFKCVIQSGYKFTKQSTINQSNQTDIEFLTGLANSETYPFTCCLVDKTLYYVKMGKLDKTATNSLTYRDYPHDIISFSPKINTETIELTSGATKTSTKKSNISSVSNGKSKTNDSSNSDKTKPKKASYTYNPANKTWKKN